MKIKPSIKSRVLVITCVLALVTAGSPRCFASDNPAAMAVDAILIRPVCLVTTVVGSAIFVISLPVAATSKSVHRAARALVVKPAEATFTRPLGDFEDLVYYSVEVRLAKPPHEHRRG